MKAVLAALLLLSALKPADNAAIGSFNGNVAGSGSFNNNANQIGGGPGCVTCAGAGRPGIGGGIGPALGGEPGVGGVGPAPGVAGPVGGIGPGGGIGPAVPPPLGGDIGGDRGGGIGPFVGGRGNPFYVPRRWGGPWSVRRPFSYGPLCDLCGGRGVPYGGGGRAGGSFNNNANTIIGAGFAAKADPKPK